MWSIYLYPSGLFIDIDMQSILVDSCYTFTHITSLSYLPLKQPCRILTKFRPVQNYNKAYTTWWRHPMGTFSTLLALCAGNSPVTGEFPALRPVTRSFDVFYDLRLNLRLNKRLSNNHEAGDLRCHYAHYDVIVMIYNSLEYKMSQVNIYLQEVYSTTQNKFH